MELNIIIILVICLLVLVPLTYFISKRSSDRKIKEYKTVSEAISVANKKLIDINETLDKAKNLLNKTDSETKSLQALKKNADTIASTLRSDTDALNSLTSQISQFSEESKAKEHVLHEILSKIDLYSKIDEFVGYGHFEVPEYLHETSLRFTEEIKQVRQKQKDLIKDKNAITYPSDTIISENTSFNKKILDGQVKLMLTALNIECDALISKVSPSSFARTLERIEKLANNIEKSAASLHCGFNINYIEHKFDECRLQYQYKLKKQEEQDEQRLIREQIREEQKAIKEYEKAVTEAEKEEKMYRDMLLKAREELKRASEEDKAITEKRIFDLEEKLAEAEAKEERAKSMAQQTRKGHVYVISNIGSFGEDVYKIGLTRRLEPLDRVKELGDASVPFTFDVHAIIYAEDAPALERDLHREFTNSRVNAVNLRKEFFRTDLLSIKDAVDRISGIEAEFNMTILAEDYYETRRLQSSSAHLI